MAKFSSTREPPFVFGGEEIAAGERRLVRLSAPDQLGRDSMSLPVHVLHGRRAGPTLFVSAAIHGDEVNGVEVIRRLLARRVLSELRGTLLAVPVANVYGFVAGSRYLPDRRDLNRSFPGREAGSLAARLAHLIRTQIVARCTHGIDLHTGAIHRTNLPHVRGSLDDERVLRLARAFGAPLILDLEGPAGTMREVTQSQGIPLLVFEGGEALRFDPVSIRTAERGILAVMRALEMLPHARPRKQPLAPAIARVRRWLRAPVSGLLLMQLELGARIEKGQIIARIADPYTGELADLRAPMSGVVLGMQVMPLVNEGDAVVHLAALDEDASASLNELFEREADDPEFLDNPEDPEREPDLDG